MTNRADQNWPKENVYELGNVSDDTVRNDSVCATADAHRILKYDGRMFERLLITVDRAVKSNREV